MHVILPLKEGSRIFLKKRKERKKRKSPLDAVVPSKGFLISVDTMSSQTKKNGKI